MCIGCNRVEEKKRQRHFWVFSVIAIGSLPVSRKKSDRLKFFWLVSQFTPYHFEIRWDSLHLLFLLLLLELVHLFHFWLLHNFACAILVHSFVLEVGIVEESENIYYKTVLTILNNIIIGVIIMIIIIIIIATIMTLTLQREQSSWCTWADSVLSWCRSLGIPVLIVSI